MIKLSYLGQSDKDVTAFIKRLPLLKMNTINFTAYEMLPLCGEGPAIAFSRFLTLSKKVVYGAYTLTNAYRKNHKDLCGNESDNSLWVRSMYFESAIESYNKVVDYIYIILYFNYELYKKFNHVKKINTKKDIIEASKKVKGKKNLDMIDNWLSLNESTADFATEFNTYILFVGKMRDLANDIKHRGCIAVEGTTLSRCTKVTREIDGKKVDITELVSEVKINLDDEIENLVEVHRRTLEIQQSLYKTCNFQKTLNDFLESNNLQIK